MATILVVDDEKNYLWMLEELFQSEGYEVLTCERAEDALPLLTEGRVDLLLTDLRMAEMDGMALLGRVRELSPATSTIIMTAFGTVERAVEAMRLGAYDFILKPFNQADLLRTVAKALERTVLLRENLRLSQTLSHHYHFDQLIGKSSLMQEVFEKIKRVAGSKSPVLITGESGSGKELVAHAIHFNGPRSGRPFLPVNCSAMTVSAQPVSGDGQFLLTISDTGVGLTAEDLKRLGEPFFTQRSGGVGLGFALARRIVTEHGGTLDASSEPGQGTTVAIRLPAHILDPPRRSVAGSVAQG